tara:strand:- start:2045 stop:3229 length:1185 start_codon:yes stop_codon:yes gene_type:complete
MSTDDRSRGWDKKAVNRIAKEVYGGLAEMFREHGWSKDGKTYGQIAPRKVKNTYGGVEAFVAAHKQGVEGNQLINPFAAIRSNPPNVWLTSFYGYDPENWGMLAFGSESDRAKFIRESEPGALIVVYGTKDLGTDEAGKVLGVQQVSHLVGPSEQFTSPAAWALKQSEASDRHRWLFGVQATRAWYIVPEERPDIEAFADTTWSKSAARAIGRYCKRMTKAEARKILKLEMFECSVYGGRQIDVPAFQKGRNALKPSRPGPVSQSGFHVAESEGPKHLYMLELKGEAIGSFVNGNLGKNRIVKVGFSKSPEARSQCFNRALPGDQFAWVVSRSTHDEGIAPYPSSHHAKAGEQAMVQYLDDHSTSLGGEFFSAKPSLLRKAWKIGKNAAEEYRK